MVRRQNTFVTESEQNNSSVVMRFAIELFFCLLVCLLKINCKVLNIGKIWSRLPTESLHHLLWLLPN